MSPLVLVARFLSPPATRTTSEVQVEFPCSRCGLDREVFRGSLRPPAHGGSRGLPAEDS